MTVVETIIYGIWWYAILSVAALLTFPLVSAACQGLSDRGLSLYRPVGIVVAILPVWWLGNITPLPFTAVTVAGSTLVLGAIGWGLVARRVEIGGLLRRHWFRLSVIEFFSGALFFGYLLMRGFNPDVRGTEKPMELAFLTAAERSTTLPVMDPWFAGEPINYYYFGYAVYGGIAKLTGLPGEMTFNLALASTFAMACVAAAGLAANLADRIPPSPRWATGASAMLAAFLLVFSGNLHAVVQLIRVPNETLSAGWWDGIGWESSRIIQDVGFEDGNPQTVITEFPAFSWILGDLHPHVLAYPWLISTIALAANLVFVLRGRSSLPAAVFHSVPVGIAIGVLYSSNTWDVPLAALTTGIALFVVSRASGWPVPIVSGFSVLLSTLLAAVPFAMNYTAPAGNPGPSGDQSTVGLPFESTISSMVGFVDWERTSLGDLLLVHGGFLALLALILVSGILQANMRSWRHLAALVLGSALLIVAAMELDTAAIAVMGLPVLVLAILLGFHGESDPAQFFLVLLVIAALLLIILLEFFFVHDPFGNRMNTVFKIYFQVWALLAISIGAILPLAIGALSDRGHIVWPGLALGFTAAILLAVGIYTPFSAYRWNNEFSSWQGLDGLRYLETNNPHEAAAIRWLRETADPSAVIVEAPGCSYGTENSTPHNRMSMTTGIPTILGWEGHQFQWRRQNPRLASEIEQREHQIRMIYEQPLKTDAPRYLSAYGVTHIVVGLHETRGYQDCDVGPPYAEEGLEDLGRTIWQPVFQSGPVRILAPHPEGYVAN